jgi:hypothetical protein
MNTTHKLLQQVGLSIMLSTCVSLLGCSMLVDTGMIIWPGRDIEEPKIGYEILQVVSPSEILVWYTSDITQEDFDAIDLPVGWMKNTPREADADSGRFARSPDAETDGDFTFRDHFGYNWRHQATVVDPRVRLDEERLLSGARVAKYHELTFKTGRTFVALVSPALETYIRVSRDAGRSTDIPTLPAGWKLEEHELTEDLVVQLPNPTLVIRTDNEDSFQGPVMIPGREP